MKKLLVLTALLFGFCASYAQTGTWSGKLDVYGTKITLVFHLEDEACTMDSPDQGVKGIPAQLERTPIGVKVTVPSINAVYEGLYAIKTITGTFTQNGQQFPLALVPGEPKRNRPQTPVGPFPYTTEEVSFSNGDAVLSGTLVLPEGFTKNTPVLLMVTGSGLQNRDEELFEHKPFAVIADALARQGVATLRYDDRGFGKSTGDVINCTTEDLKDDALSGIAILRDRFEKVGIIGHSEGGTIAFMLAAEGKVDFVVSLAGCVENGGEVLLKQNRSALAQAGLPEEIVDNYVSVLKNVFDEIKAGKTPVVAGGGLPEPLEKNLQDALPALSTPYMKYFIAMDVAPLLKNITCPVLALNGTLDRQVECGVNLGIIRKEIISPKKVMAVEGVNHLFQHCTTGDVSEYKEIEETFAPEALQVIIEWLKGLK